MKRLIVFRSVVDTASVVHCVSATLTPPSKVTGGRWKAKAEDETATADTIEEVCDELAGALCR